jgi:hypothetical protein
MNRINTPLRTFARLAAFVLAASLGMASCGGGVGTGGTGSFASGPVTGFGSVIVSGVAYDDSRAAVLDDDGLPLAGAQALRLGMTLDIEGNLPEAVAGALRATATRVQLRTALVGPVVSVDAAAGRLVVLGQDVTVTPVTVLDNRLSGGLSALRAGGVVAVHGVPDGAAILASRIEPAAADSVWRLRGPVAEYDAAARRLRIGGTVLDLRATPAVPADLAVGRIVAATLGPAPVAVPAAGLAVRRLTGTEGPAEGMQVLLEGVLSQTNAVWSINGQPLDLTGATTEPAGLAPSPGLFARVTGEQRGGRVRADRIELLGRAGLEARPFQVAGTLSVFDPATQRGEVRGVAIDFAAAVFPDGNPARLAVGAAVRVQGPLTDGGTVLRAQRVFFD